MDEHKALIAELAETIIPRTNTPGAKDVKAQNFIITLLKNVSDRKTQNSFIDGLKDIEEFSIDKYEKNFTALTVIEKRNVVEHFYKKGKNFSGKLGKAKNKFLGKSFFDILKNYTTIAYCTSRQGATEGLAYDFIPGKYDACIALKANQKAWATK
ncbi:MAG TPA: gluconate 2-dehydrogenase subunit 3 family protein [Ferruginibacter sp.]|nr:gluconate 2-dehydrogenase subunit 3 family protein [Ferruginibacter sp.]